MAKSKCFLITGYSLVKDYTFDTDLYTEIVYLTDDKASYSAHSKVMGTVKLNELADLLASDPNATVIVYEHLIEEAQSFQTSLSHIYKLKALYPKQVRCRLTNHLRRRLHNLKHQLAPVDPNQSDYWLWALWSDIFVNKKLNV